MVGEYIVGIDRLVAGGGGGGASPEPEKGRKGGAVECRICQEEGDEREMESPCKCSGTLKFAHRKCIQRWCNKKGNITCEICSQAYSPGYSIPAARSSSELISMDIGWSRQSWNGRVGLRDSHFLAIAVADQELLQDEYEDYAASTSLSAACCHILALALMLLLIVHHMLVMIKGITVLHGLSALFNVSLQLFGFFLPCFVIARSCYLIQSRRRRQM